MTAITVIIITLAQIIKADCILWFLGGWSQNIERHNKCRWENCFWNVSTCSYWKHILNLNVAKQVPDKCVIMEKNRQKWWNKRNCSTVTIGMKFLVYIYIFLFSFCIQVQRESPVQGSPHTEEIHYGQIDFSGRRQEPTSASPLDSKQHQCTLRAQVKVCEAENRSTQSPLISESVYAQVKI